MNREIKNNKIDHSIGGGQEGWNVYEQLLNRINIYKEDKILDVGCGSGELGKIINTDNLYGSDINKNLIMIAKNNSNYKKLFIEDAHNLKHKDNTFDKIISIELIQYVGNPHKAISEMLRVCKGDVIVVVPNHNCIAIRSLFFKKWRKDFIKGITERTINWTNKEFFEDISKQLGVNIKIEFISCRLGFIRNLWGELFSSELIVTFKKSSTSLGGENGN